MAAHGAEYSRAVSVLWILLLGYIVTFIAGMAGHGNHRSWAACGLS